MSHVMTAHRLATAPSAGPPAHAAGDRPGPTRPLPAGPGRRRPPAHRVAALARTARGPAALAPAEQLAQAEQLTGWLGRWYLDAQAGRRDPRQLRRLLSPTVQARVLRTVRSTRDEHRRTGARPGLVLRVRRVLVSRTGDHYEGLALVEDGVRTVAVTIALEARRSGWLVTELARPDDGLAALPSPQRG